MYRSHGDKEYLPSRSPPPLSQTKYEILQHINFVFCMQVNRRFRQGDVEGAQRASDQAQLHSHRAVVAGIIVWGTILIFLGSLVLFGFLYGIGYYEYYG